MRTGFTFALVALVPMLAAGPAYGFTEKDVQQAFSRLDEDADGKVTRAEFSAQKISVIYRNVPLDSGSLEGGDVSFEQVRISRAFFDAIDSDRNGRLSPVELSRSLQFESIASEGKDHFTREDFGRFMKGIAR